MFIKSKTAPTFSSVLGGDFSNYRHAKTTLMLGFYPCSLWTCSARHYFTHTNNTHLNLTSLIDHIYTNNPSAVVTTDVSDLSISDHNPISCTVKLPKPESKGHARVSFSSFKYFNQNAFFIDLMCKPFDNEHPHTTPTRL